jgi:hypothetical protein
MNLTKCEWEELPSFQQVVSSFIPICMDMIQLNYSTCSDNLPWYRRISSADLMIITLVTALLTVLKPLAMDVTSRLLMKYFDNAEKELTRASEMIYECATRIIVVCWTFYEVLLAPQCSYLIAPTQVLRGVWESEAGGPDMSSTRRFLLLVAISRYASALIDVLFLSPEKRRDTISLVIHHVVAVLMMTAAYTTFPELGLSVFFLHEVCDPSLELAKILHYLQTSRSGVTSKALSMSSDAFFVLFMIKWFVLRFYLYPVRGMYPGGGVDRNSCQYGSYAAAALLAAILFMLNTVWSFMIIRALVNRILYNRLTDETMDSPEDYIHKKTPTKGNLPESGKNGKVVGIGEVVADELLTQRIGNTL